MSESQKYDEPVLYQGWMRHSAENVFPKSRQILLLNGGLLFDRWKRVDKCKQIIFNLLLTTFWNIELYLYYKLLVLFTYFLLLG